MAVDRRSYICIAFKGNAIYRSVSREGWHLALQTRKLSASEQVSPRRLERPLLFSPLMATSLTCIAGPGYPGPP